MSLVMVLALSALVACDQAEEPQATTNGEQATTAEPQADPITIGIVQIVEHPALDAARDGFIEGMAEAGFIEGENVIYDIQNAQGDQSTLSTIADRFVNNEVDLILAIATPSAQAIAARTTDIPVIGTAITSYTAAELVDSDEVPGGNITGTTDMNPVGDQIQLAIDLVSDAETIGLIYSSAEANSVYQINIAKQYIEDKGLQWEERTVENTNEVHQAMQSLVRSADVIYIPTDNVVASAMAIVGEIAGEAGIATITGESGMVASGGFATMGIDYFDLGMLSAEMAVEVINGADTATMSIRTVPGDEIVISEEALERLGKTIPDRFMPYVQRLEAAE